MGYKPTKKNYLLSFEDHPGLEIRAAGASLDELDALSGMNANVMHADRSKRLELFTFFAGKLLSWNIEHPETEEAICPRCDLAENAPMPPTFKSLLCLDIDFVIQITMGWATTISRVSLPKGLNLPGGVMNGLSIPQQGGLTPADMSKLEQIQNPGKLHELNYM